MIDGEAKRYSTLQFGSLWGLSLPSGTIDQAERQDSLSVYRGILAAIPSVVVTSIADIVLYLAIEREFTIYLPIVREEVLNL